MTQSNFIPKNLYSILLMVLTLLFSCCSSNKTKNTNTEKKHKPNIKISKKEFSIIEPVEDQIVRFEESFGIKVNTKNNKIDSVEAYFGQKKLNVHKNSETGFFECSGLYGVFGSRALKLAIHYNDSLLESHSVKLLYLPSEEPKSIGYEVIRSFPHDPYAYTQGLLYKDGVLFESTGQYNRSSLREINKETGEILRKKNIEPQYFGEGIAMSGDEIFMLTYKAQIGFVFDPDNFELKRQFNLQTDEGWGLTTFNDTILLTDGSHNLYFFLPDDYFTLVKQMEICDHSGFVSNLNELEYTPYGLLSNIYGKDMICLIDIEHGSVSHVLDLKELFPDNVPMDMDHVLNGIAYNNDKKTLYVTGKQWPIMYEIKLSIE